MSPLERLEWLTKLARSGANFGMMAVASDIAYRAGDDGCFGLPDGGLKPAGARKARAALLAGGWVLRTKGAWFPAIGTATTVAKRYNGSATTVAQNATTVAVTATTVAKIATTVAHNRGTINGTINGRPKNDEDDITVSGPVDASLQTRYNYEMDAAKFAQPSHVAALRSAECKLGKNNRLLAQWLDLIGKHSLESVCDAAQSIGPSDRWPDKVSQVIWERARNMEELDMPQPDPSVTAEMAIMAAEIRRAGKAPTGPNGEEGW